MSLRRALVPALWSLRAYWGTAALLVATAALGLAALLPVTSLMGPAASGFATRLALPPWRGGDLGMGWSAFASSPTATQEAGLATLFGLLANLAAGVLAVAGLTVLALSATRASQRALETNVRRAVGAARGQLLAAGLLESASIAIGAVLLGGVLGSVAARMAIAAWPDGLSRGSEAADGVAVIATVAGVIFGALLPLAFQRRGLRPPPSGAKPLELAVPAFQLGLSLTVLTTAALLERRASELTGSALPHAQSAQVLELSDTKDPAPARAAAYMSLLRHLRVRHAFDLVSLNSPGTLTGRGMVDLVTTDCGFCWLGGIVIQFHPVRASYYLVSADTFRLLGLSTIAGRRLSDADGWGTAHVAVVSRSLALRHFENGQAVGRKMLVGRPVPDWYTVVGVVDDRQALGLGGGLQPSEAVYLSVLQHPAPAVDLIVRGSEDGGTRAALEQEFGTGVGKRSSRVVPLSESAIVTAELAPLQWFGRMFGLEGAVILLIATLGTFVVMRLWVLSRVYELGIRRAVGARRRDVFIYVLLRALGVAAGGVGVGLWVGLVVWGTLGTVVAGLPAWDLHSALRFVPVLLAAALVGALHPAWQAARAQPAKLTG